MSTFKVDDILGELSTDVINLPNKFKVGGNTIEQGYTVSTTEPSSPSEGDFWWDNANEVLYRYINGEFKDVGVSSAAAIWYGDRDLRTGFTSSTYFNDIHYNSITTSGNAADFGNVVFLKLEVPHVVMGLILIDLADLTPPLQLPA